MLAAGGGRGVGRRAAAEEEGSGAAEPAVGVLRLADDENDDKLKQQQQQSKRQRKEERVAANRKWLLVDRKLGSGVDPNPRHTLYFKAQFPQTLGKDESSWDAFHAILLVPLCVAFRVGASCPPIVVQHLERVLATGGALSRLQGRCFEYNGRIVRDEVVNKIAWGGGVAWQVCCDSSTLAHEPALEKLSGFLRREVSLGHCCRQELASMLPVLFLDLQAHHSVLDVCAAPGSKTEQLLARVKEEAGGLVVANDADPKRIKTLCARFRRAGAPNLLVTCSRAEDLGKRLHGRNVFDRIVADVPCSGDGTIRKFHHIWRNFRPRVAVELHSIQLQIAIAAVGMLKPGGRFVYSTCSLNPLEDEAVVSGLLQHFGGRLSLVKTALPGLQTRPGLSTWKASPEVFTIGEPDEASRKASLARLPDLTPTMSPPSEELAQSMHLEFCHRIFPHDQDMGGFFVAVLELAAEAAEGSGAAALAVASAASAVAVSKTKSLKTFKQLGYNPADATNRAAEGEAGDYDDGQAYSQVDSVVANALLAKASKARGNALIQSTYSRYAALDAREVVGGGSGESSGDEEEEEGKGKKRTRVEKDDSLSNGIFGSRKNGWLKIAPPPVEKEEEKVYASIVSAAVQKLAHSRLLNAKRVAIEQMGVEIGSIGRESGVLTLNGDNLFVCSQHIADAHPPLEVPLSLFQRLCQAGRNSRTVPDELEQELVESYSPSPLPRLCLLQAASIFDKAALKAGADDVADAGKRRLSKAEKKRLGKGAPSAAAAAQRDDTNTASFDPRGLVLALQQVEDRLGFVTAPDACASYFEAIQSSAFGLVVQTGLSD